MPSDPDQPPVEAHGPAEAEIGKIKQVPPHTTLPYTLGQTPEQQKRVILIGAVLWGCVVLLVLKSYVFGI